MMRANLLPRQRESVGLFGIRIPLEHVRGASIVLVAVVLITLAAIGFETVRLHRIQNQAVAEESVLETRASEREETRRIALDVARYQEIAREEVIARRSGTVAAILIARIGNTIPSRVWLDSISHDDAGFEILGAARSLDALSEAVLRLGRALPGSEATLVNVDNRDAPAYGVRFTARVPAMEKTRGGEGQ